MIGKGYTKMHGQRNIKILFFRLLLKERLKYCYDCADKFDCDNCVCKSRSYPYVWVTGGVRL